MKDSMKKSAILAAAATMLAGMTSCGPAIPFGAPGQNLSRVGSFAANPARAGKKWTVIVHLAADNNLYPFGLEDMNEMEAGLAQNPAAAAAVDVIVMFDGTPTGDSKIYRIKPDPGAPNTKLVSEVIDDKGAVIPPSHEIDSGDVTTATKFVEFATKNFPSEHTVYDVWNHGSGIFRGARPNPRVLPPVGSFMNLLEGGEVGERGATKGFAWDDHGKNMGLRDVNTFMAPAMKNLGRPVDIIDFDACLMQHIETAYQFKGLANILVASEQTEAGDGMDYEAFIGAIAKNPDISPVDLSKAMVRTYNQQYVASGDEATLSAVDINAVANIFVPALNDYANELKASLSSSKAAIATAREQTQMFYNRDAADLGDFLKKFKGGPAADKLRDAFNKTLIEEAHNGPEVAHATGIQVYFPTATMSVNRNYDDPNFMRFAETKGWSSFLHAFTGK